MLSRAYPMRLTASRFLRCSGIAPTLSSSVSSKSQSKRVGTICEWHPFERRGKIVDDTTGNTFHIANTRAFETVLPTMLRTLDGAKVQFDVASATAFDRVIVRSRTVPITAGSYMKKPPVDFLLPSSSSSSENPAGADPVEEALSSEDVLFAHNIVVDMSSISSDQLVRLSGPLVHEEVVPPPKNLKDMRSSCILDRKTNEYLRLRHQLGSSEEAREVMKKRAAEEEMRAVRRTVIAAKVSGTVKAWSTIYRSGIIMEGESQDNEPASPLSVQDGREACIIRSAHCFESALPTSNKLVGRHVTFTKVTYSSHPDKYFAENIILEGKLDFDLSTSTAEDARRLKMQEKREMKWERQLGAKYFDQTDTNDGGTLPEGPLYGVVTRWSGGQGTVEHSGGTSFYIRSGADFVQLVDQDSCAIRGAVVTFYVDQSNPRYATQVNILSTATYSIADMKPLLDRANRSTATDPEKWRVGASPTHATSTKDKESSRQEDNGPAAVKPPVGVEWCYGMLLNWSPQEEQGIIHGDDGHRYVLRDVTEHVMYYKEHQHLLKKGRRVKFMPYGSTGRLACSVLVLDAEATEDEVGEEELRPREPHFSLDGNVNEAIASPMSTTYWINRMDKAGFDTSEVKKLQNRALTLNEEDGEDGTEDANFLDSETIMKQDHWWHDPRKNVRFPNSDMTAGQLALIGPASMMNMALKAKDPKRMEKMKNKYYNRLTEEQKEYAWKQAKEMAPKYEENIKRARQRNEEPTFYFY